MTIGEVSLINQNAKNQTVTVAENKTAKKNNWMIFGYVFLTIGTIFALVSTGGFLHIFHSISTYTSETILGMAATAIFIGGATILINFYKTKIKAKTIVYNPKDFGIIGIKNTNNNCWLNSLLQILLNNTNLKQMLQTNENFKRFIQQYDLAVERGEMPDSNFLRNYLSKHTTITTDSTIQDLHEPLTYILDLLREKNLSLLNTLTTIKYTKSNTSDKSYTNVEKQNINGIINLPFPDGENKTSLSNLIQSYFYSPQDYEFNIIEDKEKTVKQNRFFGLWNTIKTVIESTIVDRVHCFLEERKLAFAPENLFFNVQRYQVDPSVYVPVNLHLAGKYFVNNQTTNYTLESFACHIKGMMHYISYIKKNGIWFLCNDTSVKSVSEEAAIEAAKKAYVLQYKKNNV